ncbi:MAG: 1-acyl-sn-glycerol-3-phosphate acyltransferase [Myxococcota bacterium]|nr:1-acyl-sn-glycerol-3-phosphate acyltransferase [Myxococcota bacterium]
MRPRAYDWVVKLAHLLLRFFFRQVEVTGTEHIPRDGGGILVSWHPNGMIDPALIFETFPRQVVFGARHGLFRVPVLGHLMRAIGTVPIFRAMDAKKLDERARRAANARSLDALAERVAQGSFSCLFPEGDSHDEPHLLALKTGVARFYYRSRELMKDGAPPPVIIPVGLHYDEKRLFRSSVLVTYHPPMELPPGLDVTPDPEEPEETTRERQRLLTDAIDHVLREVVHATESWDIHRLMHRARKIVRAERASRTDSELEKPTMEEKMRAFSRIWAGYYQRLESHPEEVAALKARVREYDRDLRALEMEDHELDRGPPILNPWIAVLLGLQVLLVYFLLPPILVFGVIVNAPPALALWLVTRAAAKRKKDEASIKVLVGAVLFPLTWIGLGVAAGVGHAMAHEMYGGIPDTPIAAGLLVTSLSFLGGAIALRYVRLARETARAVRVRLTRERRRMTVARLQVDRSELHDGLVALARGLELPGTLMPDGRVLASDPAATR